MNEPITSRKFTARFLGFIGIVFLVFSSIAINTTIHNLSDSTNVQGTIIYHNEVRHNRNLHITTIIEYEGNEYNSKTMQYGSVSKLNKNGKTVNLSILDDGNVEITQAIKNHKSAEIFLMIVGLVFMAVGVVFGGWGLFRKTEKTKTL